MGLVVDYGNNNIYVTDSHLVARINSINTNLPDGAAESYSVTPLAGNQNAGLRDANGTSARFHSPFFVTIDLTNSYLYISDTLNYRLRRVSLNDPLYSVVTYGSFTTAGTGGQLTNGIVLDTEGQNIYAVATYLNGIWKIPVLSNAAYPSPSAGWTLLNGNGATGTAKLATGQLVDGTLATSQWFSPGAISIDSQDNLYIIDNYQTSSLSGSTMTLQTQIGIRRVSTQSSFVTTIAGKFCRVQYSTSVTNNDPADVCTQSSGVTGYYVNGNGTQTGFSKDPRRSVGGYLVAGA